MNFVPPPYVNSAPAAHVPVGRMLMCATVGVTIRAFLLPYAADLRRRGWQVDAVAADIGQLDPADEYFHNKHSVSWARSFWRPRRILVAMVELRRIIRDGRYDIVHTHTPVASFLARVVCRTLPLPNRPKVIYTAHGFHFYRGGNTVTSAFFLLLEKFAGHFTDYIVVINREDFEAVHRHRIVPASAVFFTPGIGVDLARYSRPVDREARAAVLCQELGLDQNVPLLLVVAEFIPRKRQIDVLLAMRQCQHRTFHVVFVGEGPLLPRMKQLAKRWGLSERCHFVGFTDRVPHLMGAVTGLLLPSTREGLPRSVMEAMAVGTPVVGSDIRGTHELLRDACGLLVPAKRPTALAEAIDRLLLSRVLRETLVENATRQIACYALGPLLDWYAQFCFAILRGDPAPAFASCASEAKLRPFPRRVLIVGGIAKSLVNFRGQLLRDLKASGCEVVAVASDDDGQVRDTLARWDVRFFVSLVS